MCGLQAEANILPPCNIRATYRGRGYVMVQIVIAVVGLDPGCAGSSKLVAEIHRAVRVGTVASLSIMMADLPGLKAQTAQTVTRARLVPVAKRLEQRTEAPRQISRSVTQIPTAQPIHRPVPLKVSAFSVIPERMSAMATYHWFARIWRAMR